MGTRGVMALAPVLLHLTRLQHLDLAYNWVKGLGTLALVLQLRGLGALHSLALDHVGLDPGLGCEVAGLDAGRLVELLCEAVVVCARGGLELAFE